MLENRGKLILQPGYLGVAQAEPRQRGHIFNFSRVSGMMLESTDLSAIATCNRFAYAEAGRRVYHGPFCRRLARSRARCTCDGMSFFTEHTPAVVLASAVARIAAGTQADHAVLSDCESDPIRLIIGLGSPDRVVIHG